MNTTKMEKGFKDGREYAFSKVRKIDGEYVVKVYIDGEYSEDYTYYTDDKEDADKEGEAVTPGHLAKEGVPFDTIDLRHKAVRIHVEQGTEYQKEPDDEDLNGGTHHHVLL